MNYPLLLSIILQVRVTATNDLSEGPASDPVTFKTGSGELPPEIKIDTPEKPAKVYTLQQGYGVR